MTLADRAIEIIEEIVADELLSADRVVSIVRAVVEAIRTSDDPATLELVSESARKMRDDLSSSDERHDEALEKKFE